MKDDVKEKVKEHFLMPDGTLADPDSFEKGEDGVLKNKAGVSPLKGSEGKPQTFGEYSEGTMNAQAAEMGKPEDSKPEPKKDDEFKFAKPPAEGQDQAGMGQRHDGANQTSASQASQSHAPGTTAARPGDNVVRQPPSHT